jgi:hypothetical protein
MLIQSGKNPKQVQRWLGYARASITMDVYSHLMDEGLGETPFAPMLTDTRELSNAATGVGKNAGPSGRYRVSVSAAGSSELGFQQAGS